MVDFIGSAKADYVGFDNDSYINDDTTDREQSAVAMATYGTEIYLVWHDMRNGDFDIYFTKSTDGGATWGDGIDNNNDVRVDDTDSNLNNTDNETSQKNPDITVDGSGNIYVVWQDNREGRSDNDIYFAKSTDGGSTFGTNKRVDHNGSGAFDQEHPCIAADVGGNIYVAWQDERNGLADSDIYFTKSTDGGANFASPDVLVDDDTNTGRLQQYPQFALEETGGTPILYLVWQDERIGVSNFDIYFTKSIDGGISWGDGIDNNNDVRINDNTVSVQEHPSIAIDGNGDLVVVWDDERDGNWKNIYWSSSSDSGSTWATNKKLYDSESNTTAQANPVIATYNNNIAVAWIDDRNGGAQTDIYFTLSRNNGATFGPFMKADQGGVDTIQAQPQIEFVGTNSIYIAWEDNRIESRGLDIYFAKSGWIILAAPVLSDDSFTPKMAQAETEFHFTVVYTDLEDDPPAADYPKLYLFKDDAGTDPYTGSPFLMIRQEIPVQDNLYSNGMIYEKRITLGEAHNYSYYIATKALKGNTTLIASNLTKGPRLDLESVEFSKPFPTGIEWFNKARVNCSISIRDIGFAGVDPISIMYRTTTSGTTNFGEWTNSGMRYYITPEWVNVSANIFFNDGIDNYIEWRASDKYGNGPVESDYYQINIDTTPVAFSEPHPDPSQNYWYNTEKIEVGISVTDYVGSGVNASTIEYSYTTTGVDYFGDWTSAGALTNGEEVVVRTDVTFANGTQNYLRWRALDMLGNGPNVSATYHFRIDTSLKLPKINHPPTPPTNVKPVSTIDRTPYITWDAGTDEDKDDLRYFIQLGTSVNGSDVLAWMNLGDKLGYQVGKNLNVGNYYIHLKSYDGLDFSEVVIVEMAITTEGNTPPQPPTSLTPLFTAEKKPNFEWSGAYDAESDPLTYYILIGITSGAEDILPFTWIGFGTHYDYNGAPLANGKYYVQIIVYDSKDWSEPGEFVVKIADYSLNILSQYPVSIPQGESRTISVNVTNAGSSDDNIMLNYSNALEGVANLTFSQDNIMLSAGNQGTVTLKIAVPPDSKTGDYYLKLTATSEDGVTSASYTVIVTVTESEIGPPPDGNGKDGDGNDNDGLGTPDFSGWLAGMFFWLVLLMIIFVAIIFVYLGMRGRRKRAADEDEKAREREKYDEMYSREGEQPPPPPPGGAYDAYEGYGPGDGTYETYPESQAPPSPPQGSEQYYDYYGTQYEGTVRPAQEAVVYDSVPQAQYQETAQYPAAAEQQVRAASGVQPPPTVNGAIPPQPAATPAAEAGTDQAAKDASAPAVTKPKGQT